MCVEPSCLGLIIFFLLEAIDRLDASIYNRACALYAGNSAPAKHNESFCGYRKLVESVPFCMLTRA